MSESEVYQVLVRSFLRHEMREGRTHCSLYWATIL